MNQLTFDSQNVSYKHITFPLQAWYQWLDLIVDVMPLCRVAVIDEIYHNYEIQEMLSFKKAQKVRIKGTEILLTFLIGMLKLRNTKANPS